MRATRAAVLSAGARVRVVPVGVMQRRGRTDQEKAQEAAAKVKEKVGEVTDNRDLQARASPIRPMANVKQAGENIKDTFKK